jgi:hypothetical protein
MVLAEALGVYPSSSGGGATFNPREVPVGLRTVGRA